MEEWVFHFLSNVAIKVTADQKQEIIKKLADLLRNDATGVIELNAEDGSAVGFRSDSIVAWLKVGTPSPVLRADAAPVHAA